jgi:hypothetical protein
MRSFLALIWRNWIDATICLGAVILTVVDFCVGMWGVGLFMAVIALYAVNSIRQAERIRELEK